MESLNIWYAFARESPSILSSPMLVIWCKQGCRKGSHRQQGGLREWPRKECLPPQPVIKLKGDRRQHASYPWKFNMVWVLGPNLCQLVTSVLGSQPAPTLQLWAALYAGWLYFLNPIKTCKLSCYIATPWVNPSSSFVTSNNRTAPKV